MWSMWRSLRTVVSPSMDALAEGALSARGVFSRSAIVEYWTVRLCVRRDRGYMQLKYNHIVGTGHLLRSTNLEWDPGIGLLSAKHLERPACLSAGYVCRRVLRGFCFSYHLLSRTHFSHAGVSVQYDQITPRRFLRHPGLDTITHG